MESFRMKKHKVSCREEGERCLLMSLECLAFLAMCNETVLFFMSWRPTIYSLYSRPIAISPSIIPTIPGNAHKSVPVKLPYVCLRVRWELISSLRDVWLHYIACYSCGKARYPNSFNAVVAQPAFPQEMNRCHSTREVD